MCSWEWHGMTHVNIILSRLVWPGLIALFNSSPFFHALPHWETKSPMACRISWVAVPQSLQPGVCRLSCWFLSSEVCWLDLTFWLKHWSVKTKVGQKMTGGQYGSMHHFGSSMSSVQVFKSWHLARLKSSESTIWEQICLCWRQISFQFPTTFIWKHQFDHCNLTAGQTPQNVGDTTLGRTLDSPFAVLYLESLVEVSPRAKQTFQTFLNMCRVYVLILSNIQVYTMSLGTPDSVYYEQAYFRTLVCSVAP